MSGTKDGITGDAESGGGAGDAAGGSGSRTGVGGDAGDAGSRTEAGGGDAGDAGGVVGGDAAGGAGIRAGAGGSRTGAGGGDVGDAGGVVGGDAAGGAAGDAGDAGGVVGGDAAGDAGSRAAAGGSRAGAGGAVGDDDAGSRAGAGRGEARRLEPPVSDAARPFWDATRDERLVIPWCTDCEQPFWYPREVCPACLGSAIDWKEASGRGVVYACTVEHTAQTPALEAPYVVALVELDEGVRLMTNVVGCPPDQVAVGDRVQVTWEALSDGRHLPLFAPA
jgi:uncharacterized OB-fold protein